MPRARLARLRVRLPRIRLAILRLLTSAAGPHYLPLAALGALWVAALLAPPAALATGPAVSLTQGRVHFQPTRTVAQQFNQALALSCDRATPCQNLTYQGGPVMNPANSYLIFWLPSGVHFETSAATDANYEGYLERYFRDVSASPMHNILSQYYDQVGAQAVYPPNQSGLGGVYLDTTPYPHAGTAGDPLQDADLQAEIQSDISVNDWPTGPNDLFLIYTGSGIQSCYGGYCSGTDFCAYHSYFYLGNTPVIYANEPDAATVGAVGACSSGGPYPNDSYADPTTNVMSHEFFESSSDPLENAWYDGSTSGEIGDQCNFIFGPEDPSGADVYLNGNPYQVQEEWSNAASSCTTSDPGQFIDLSPFAASGTYGATIPVTAQATSLLPVTFSSNTPSTCTVSGTLVQPIHPGACTVQATQAGGGGSFYSAAAAVSTSTTIDPALLTVDAPTFTRFAGAANPALTPTYAGFQNGDTVAAPATCATTATPASPVGSYLVTCGGASDPNYTFAYVNGTLAVGITPGMDVLSVRDNLTPLAASYSLQQTASTGFNWVLVQVSWAALEPSPGVFDWGTVDDILAQTARYGLTPVLRIGDAPSWANGSSDPTAPPRNPSDFGTFMGALVGHLGNRAAGYVIWNEPNLSTEWGGQAPNPAAYLSLLQQAYIQAKAANPAAVIVSAPLAPTDNQDSTALDDRIYLADLYADGLRTSSDVIGMNAPGFASAPTDTSDPNQFYFTRVAQLHAIMTQNGDRTKQAWAIELGWLRQATVDLGAYDWMEVPETTRAQYLVQAYQLAATEWPWMGVMFTWNLDYAQYVPTSDQKGWYGLLDASGTPLPSYNALAAMPKPPPTWTPTPSASPTARPVFLPFVTNGCTTCGP
jgi:hypothetical protein